MPEEPLDPILIQVTVPLPISMIFAAFLDPNQLHGWLCESAKVEPKVGGAYELTWKEPIPFTSHGTIRQLNADVDLEFGWTSPPDFARWMNSPSPKTRVYVRLQDSPEGIDVTLEHLGWESGEPWEMARSWHFHFWEDRLERLKAFLMKSAYG